MTKTSSVCGSQGGLCQALEEWRGPSVAASAPISSLPASTVHSSTHRRKKGHVQDTSVHVSPVRTPAQAGHPEVLMAPARARGPQDRSMGSEGWTLTAQAWLPRHGEQVLKGPLDLLPHPPTSAQATPPSLNSVFFPSWSFAIATRHSSCTLDNLAFSFLRNSLFKLSSGPSLGCRICEATGLSC